jgi:predicted esterase
MAIGFGGSVWAAGSRTEPNLLVLLHGLGDTPRPFAKLAERLALPQTSALALRAPLPLPAGLDGFAWHEAFELDTGDLIQPNTGERRRTGSLASATRTRLRRLVRLLVQHGWPHRRLFLFGFAQGGTAALDFVCHGGGLERARVMTGADAVAAASGPTAGASGCAMGALGGVISWCGLPLPEAVLPESSLPESSLPDAGVRGSHRTDDDSLPGMPDTALRGMPDTALQGTPLRGTPLLLACGDQDPLMPLALACRLFESARTRLGLRLREGTGKGTGTDAETDVDRDAPPWALVQDRAPAAELHLLRGKAQAMVGNADEARTLMRFLARYLELAASLEDDPGLHRVV